MTETLTDHAVKKAKTTYLRDYTPPHFLIENVKLHVDLRENEAIVTSHLMFYRNKASKAVSPHLVLNGENLTLLSLSMNGEKIKLSGYELQEDKLIIKNVPDVFDLETVVRIEPQNNTELSGLYRSEKTFCTQCEAEGFRRITYFLDRPDVLSKYHVTILADKKKYPALLSNGNLIGEGEAEDNKHFVIFEDPHPKPSYLFALVAGDFDLLEDSFKTMSGRTVCLRVYVEKGYLNASHHAMYSVKEAMRWDEKAYGREYDLDLYMIVAISDFNMGAMENKGLNIFNTKYILAKPETATDLNYIAISSVIAHEYFHNWSGNRVTCRDWFQLSLKEGLTIFRDQSFSEDTFSKAVMRIRDVKELRETQFPEDAGALAHSVCPDSYIEINNFYTATIYNKGAEVLRMLQTIIGMTLFRQAMDRYFEKFDGRAVTIEDFIQNMAEVSERDLSQFHLWYTQAGTPLVRVLEDYDAHNKTYTLTFSQHTPETPNQLIKKPLYIPIRMGLMNKRGGTFPLELNNQESSHEVVLHFTEASQSFQFKNIDSAPIPSLFRGFSAPVKLNFSMNRAHLLFLARYDQDSFNRYEAAQQYFLSVMLELVLKKEHNQALSLPNEFTQLVHYLLDHEKDLFLLAETLTLPSEQYIGEQMQIVAVDAIHQVREYIIHTLAHTLKPHFLNAYEANKSVGDYQFNMTEVGKRQLKNRCLLYLSVLPEMSELAIKQFNVALGVNMTDTLPALTALAQLHLPAKEKALSDYFNKWQHEPLAMDHWLSIQAAATLHDTLEKVEALQASPVFNIKNPNKVYALVGSFGVRNPFCFHNKNGSGYAFLANMVKELDKLNPQVAARMVKPLTSFRRYDKERQLLMKTQLISILQEKTISPDLYELVIKSLDERKAS